VLTIEEDTWGGILFLRLKLKIYEGLPVDENLNRDLILSRNDRNVSSRGRVLITHKGSLEEEVEVWE
jgi:hypothetical protein